ncbi:hypothetical protein VTO73DRAFT_6578 [Trametes versicolor]
MGRPVNAPRRGPTRSGAPDEVEPRMFCGGLRETAPASMLTHRRRGPRRPAREDIWERCQRGMRMLRQQDAHVRIAFDEHARSAGAAEHPMCTAGPSAHASGRRAAVPSHHAAPGHNAAGAVSARNASAAGRECAIGDATCAVSYLLSVSPPPRHTWSASPLASAEAGPCAPGAEYGTKQRGTHGATGCAFSAPRLATPGWNTPRGVVLGRKPQDLPSSAGHIFVSEDDFTRVRNTRSPRVAVHPRVLSPRRAAHTRLHMPSSILCTDTPSKGGREIFVQHKQISYFISSTLPGERCLRRLWVDPTTREQTHAPGLSRAHAGLVYPLTPDENLWRGHKTLNSNRDNQSGFAIYPAWLPRDFARSAFVLTRSPFNPRAIVLEFHNPQGECLCVEIRLRLHVSAQVFTKSEWENSICKVPRNIRGFKVAVAFDLDDYVLAFLSHDLLFQMQWAVSLEGLPSMHVSDVLGDWQNFLRLRLSLTEKDLFDNGSRTARLCLAFHAFASDCEKKLWPSMKRYLHGFKFAAERYDRLFFSQYLQVYGKLRTSLCPRHGSLVDSAIQATGPASRPGAVLDVFEPSLVQTPLTMQDGNLGSLVFGEEQWKLLKMSWGLDITIPEKPEKQDALTKFYRSFQWAERTYLPQKDYYVQGLKHGQQNARHFQTTMYRFSLSAIDSSPSPASSSQRRARKNKKVAIEDNSDEDDDVSNDEGLAGRKKKTRTFQAWSIIPILRYVKRPIRA